MIFGDPEKGQPLSNIDTGKVDTVCHAGDNICDGGYLVLAPHLTYAQDAASAAAFVVGKAGLKDGAGRCTGDGADISLLRRTAGKEDGYGFTTNIVGDVVLGAACEGGRRGVREPAEHKQRT